MLCRERVDFIAFGTCGAWPACRCPCYVRRVRGQSKSELKDVPLPLVLLPGTLCDERVFAALIRSLPDIETRVIVAPHASSVQQAAEYVLSEAPERFAVLGFSLGGMVAMQIASQAPERVRGLALVSTSPLPVPVERHAARREAVDRAGLMPMDAFVRLHLWPDYCGHSTRLEENDAHLNLLQAMAMSFGPLVFCSQTEMALHRPDFRPMLGDVHCPALVLAGSEDTLCPPEAQHILHCGLKGSTLHMIDGAGHLALLQRPDEIAQAVAAWLHTVLQQGRTRFVKTAARQQESE